MMEHHIDPFTIACSAIIGLLGLLIVRLTVCLPAYRSHNQRKVKEGELRPMIVFGSGGHTTEMLMLISQLLPHQIGPCHCVLAHSDRTTEGKVLKSDLPILCGASWYHVYRSREVKQSWTTTIFTSLRALVESLLLAYRVRPKLLLCNGPGTCVPLCIAVFLFRLVGVFDCDIIFIESFCRVQKLSLSGKILYHISDRFIVQWPQLASQYQRSEYLGDFSSSDQ